jgi:hypothetical protein
VLHGPDGARPHHHATFVTTDMIALNAAVAGVGVVQLPLVMAEG